MGKKLIIVESPAKIKTLKKFLGRNYSFESSIGHIRDLPQKEFGIDTEHGFTPQYVNLEEKKDVIQKLKKAAKEAELVLLAPDPDREGEAIAWHITQILPKDTPVKRMTFHSITKDAVLEALEHTRKIDMDLVNAQQARRLLDRIVGYKISPILTKKIRRGKQGTSAGRVQSVALEFIVERERQIDSFVPIEYWTLKTILTKKKNSRPIEAILYSVDGKRIEKEKDKEKDIVQVSSQKDAEKLAERLKKAQFSVSSIEKKEKKRFPVPPFITSTLQQEASRHFGFPVARTMNIAQTLYEGVDMGDEGIEGLITYMRTDSVQVAKEALVAARSYIKNTFGEKFLPEKEIHYTSKKSAQEAHEAIRPTNLDHPPEKIQSYLTPDQFKIYSLIWKRFVASQMNPAIYDTISVEITTDNHLVLKASGSHIKFSGFLMAYEERTDKISDDEKEKEQILPPLEEGEALFLKEVDPVQSFTKPPPRYTEASLVKELEKSGVGRPSTYASIMSKIQSREYTTKEKNTLRPTELGKIIAQMLEENFRAIVDPGFTAAMEDDLELVAEGKRNWKELLGEFWKEFMPMVERAAKEATIPKITTNILCPKCKKPLQKIWSKNKYFYGCSDYPNCDFTAPIEALEFKKEDYHEDFDWEQKCPICKSPMTLRHGRFGPFLGCSKYPDCKGIVTIPKKGETLSETKNLPQCPAIGCEGKILSRRSRFGKIFYSCSLFPECDVIVNDVADLEKKYKNHPKTAYQKRGKGGKGFAQKRTFQLSEELAAVVEEKELSRSDVLKKLWTYIKAHKLQNPKNKREILPDEKLAKVFGSKEGLDMMQLARVLKNHLK
jgi:DNA topoisomerase I